MKYLTEHEDLAYDRDDDETFIYDENNPADYRRRIEEQFEQLVDDAQS